jgi:hypothetical protein
MKKTNFFASSKIKSLKKGVGLRVGSGSGSGSIRQRYRSGDPDPDTHQNVTDQQHCRQHIFRYYKVIPSIAQIN